MLETNKKIVIPGDSLLEALAEIEFILISLHKMGSFYSDKPTEDYQRATTEFIDNEKVTQKLAKVRRILSENFDNSLGPDEMDDIERRMENIEFWKPQ
ncbi:hypothetical protein [Pseudomonas frederiksbergensis]|uniref:hypothetical protein n=1 Tax=Pseudomonas frederiksbergensis TaxID=104087 RepID=UPI000F4AD061|nr:hypothetical protein [Pseudomonas frederiksbergensis]RON56321.1 hypothetical protein BK667_08235 [Pseudomonas frederiksbergensis]